MKVEPTYQKLRGGYYTPKPISDFIAKWAIQSKESIVLEPSCGDGNFLESLVSVYHELGLKSGSEIASNIKGIEYDIEESQKSLHRLKNLGIPQNNNSVLNGDFFSYCKKFLAEGLFFDAIVGNPPFIRYQNFLEEHRTIAFEIMTNAGLKPTRLTNAWVPFLIASSLLLTKNGRLGMVIPAELFQVSYASETRQFLSDYFSKITIVTFKKLVFDDIQQEVVLLLCEKNGKENTGIKVAELNDVEDLVTFNPKDLLSLELKPLDHSKDKWTQYYLTAEEIMMLRNLRKHPKVTVSGDVIDVDVGVVTGLNEYFVLNENEAIDRNLTSYTKRIITRSAHLEGAIMTEADWANNVAKQYSTSLFYPPDLPIEEQSNEVQQYITYGEEIGVNKGYKCRIRKRWFIVPSIWTPDGFILRQVHGYPKIIINEVGATCTDTVHRVRFKDGYNGRFIAAAFVNSLTLAFSEVVGRSYGGGVLTFEPSESENLPLPLIGAEKLDLLEIDKLLRANDVEAVLDITDKVLLIEGLGLTQQETLKLRDIWRKLRDRRINRKKR
ncbi:N-6 DNA methylase [Brevibacillus borstelensis]|uniref:N-6 DNA methylase n=1 Tax=Brevibacillus borstelensis TaxID=45462 RepID=UPI001D0A9E89|nr:class I SAM-dependent methyltransferase [Brevibacillus borstelensis]MCC0563797.1 class I SAM-dependent methyltransferase [Brevibacillus borstelensis]